MATVLQWQRYCKTNSRKKHFWLKYRCFATDDKTAGVNIIAFHCFFFVFEKKNNLLNVTKCYYTMMTEFDS